MGAQYGFIGAVDPRELARQCAQADPPIPADRWWGKANSFAFGPGREPGRGWVLLRKSDLDQLDLTVDQTLSFSGTDSDHVADLYPITLIQTECVTPGSSQDANAVYLCEMADRRHLLGMRPLDKAYNLSTPDGTAFFAQTEDSGSEWTWQQVVTDIATVLDLELTLPCTPDGNPENLVFWGHPSALTCLCDVLTRLACDLAYDPIADEFSIVRLGVAKDTVLTAIDADRTWDGYSAEYTRAFYPETIRVRFPRRPVDWTNGYSPYYLQDVNLTGAPGVESGTYVQIDDDLTALGASGTPSNTAALTSRANERATDWLRKRLYYDRPVLRAWVDFLPDATGLAGYAVRRVIFDDRGGPMQTAARAEPDGALEKWRPLGGWPVWWPFDSGTSPPPPPPPTTTGGCLCPWLAALAQQDCLAVSVNGTATGVNLTSSDRVTWSNAAAKTITICGITYTVSFTRGGNGVLPTLTLTGSGSGAQTFDGYVACCDCNYISFAFSTLDLCGGCLVAGGPCENVTTVRLDWGCEIPVCVVDGVQYYAPQQMVLQVTNWNTNPLSGCPGQYTNLQVTLTYYPGGVFGGFNHVAGWFGCYAVPGEENTYLQFLFAYGPSGYTFAIDGKTGPGDQCDPGSWPPNFGDGTCSTWTVPGCPVSGFPLTLNLPGIPANCLCNGPGITGGSFQGIIYAGSTGPGYPIPGYSGEGYYCVAPATNASACSAVLLTDAESCNYSVVICSGPYATLPEAQAVCPGN